MAYRRASLKHPVTGPPPGNPFLTTAELASTFKDGDFAREPWFEAEDLDRYFTSRGFPRERRNLAVAGLRRVYPPEVCRDLLHRPLHGGLVAPLFVGAIVPHIFTRFQLGLDLQVCQPWQDAELLARLRNANSFVEARAELEVWANLREAGVALVREPLTTAGKRPDFRVDLESGQYFIEVKMLDESDSEAFAKELHADLLHDIPHELFRVTQVVTIHSSPAYARMAQTQAGLDRLDAERELIREAFQNAYADLISAGVPPGVYEVPPFGTVTVASADPARGGNEVGVDFVADADLEKRAVRGARLFSRACAQLPSDGTGVVLVRAREGVPLEPLLERIRTWASENEEAVENCDVFVVRTPVRLPNDEIAHAVGIAPLHDRRLGDHEVTLLRTAARPRHPAVPDPWGGDEPKKTK